MLTDLFHTLAVVQGTGSMNESKATEQIGNFLQFRFLIILPRYFFFKANPKLNKTKLIAHVAKIIVPLDIGDLLMHI